MRMIRLERAARSRDGEVELEILTSKKNGEARVWLEYMLADGSVCRQEGQYCRDEKGLSRWIIQTGLPHECDGVLHGSDGGLTASYGVLEFRGESWRCTKEWADNDIDIISMNLTYQCNLSCSMCWQANNRRQGSWPEGHMKYSDFQIIMDRVEKLSPSKIFLWGGEPLLHPDLARIIREVKNRKFSCSLITNGLRLEEMADELLAERIDMICVSLDGIGPIHDEVRGYAGAYEKAVCGIRSILQKRKFRPVISINMVISESNYKHLYETAGEFVRLGVNGIQVQYPVFFDFDAGRRTQEYVSGVLGLPISRWQGFVAENPAIDPIAVQEQIAGIRRDFPQVQFYPGDLSALDWFSGERKDRQIACRTPWRRLNIEPNGDVAICNDHADMVAGNLLHSELQVLWNNERFRSFRREVSRTNFMPICQSCTYSYLG